MKKLFFLMFLGCASVAISQQKQDDMMGSVNVIGEAEMTVKPDYIEIRIMASEEASSPSVAHEAVMKEMKSILELLRSTPEVSEIQTQSVDLRPRIRDYEKGVKDFVSQQVVSFRLNAPDSFDKLMIKLLERGIAGIHGVEFRSSDMEKYRQVLLQRAVVDAREKAMLLASELGQEIGKATYISDHVPAQDPRPMMELKMSSDHSSIETGKIQLRATVNVQFILK